MDTELSIDEIFRKAVSLGCSDIHITPNSPPKMRKNGDLVLIPGYERHVLSGAQTDLMSFRTMGPQNLGAFNTKVFSHDYAYELQGVGRFRINIFRTRGLKAFVARLLQDSPKSLKELEVPEAINKMAESKNGIIIVTGATGSGKSTTLAGIIDYINKTKKVNIISAEDPIEIVHTNALSSVLQREVGVDVASFDSALNDALREDPDVILVGEIRSLETLKTAIRAADTGHLVLTTLHTTDTTEAINRIITMYPYNERDEIRRALASSLRGIISQRLVVKKEENGRLPVNEILVNTAEIADLILDKEKSARDFKDLISKSRDKGMQTFEQAFVDLIEQDKITLEVAKENSNHPEFYDEYYATRKEMKEHGLPSIPSHISTPTPKLTALPKKPSSTPLPLVKPTLAAPRKHRNSNPLA